MKKILIVFSLLLAVFLAGNAVQAQPFKTQQIAFGAKGVDSINGATTVYFYVNNAQTAALSHTKAVNPLRDYYPVAMQANYVHPAVYTASDSAHFWWEYSLDNLTWVKWTNAGATSTATNIINWQNAPQVTGSNSTYLIAGDFVVTTSTDAGGVWRPRNMYVPYLRMAVQRYKATSSGYVTAWVTLAPLK